MIFEALASNDIDVYVDYTGTLWLNQFQQTAIKPRAELIADLTKILADKYKITLLGDLGFANAYALVMPKKRADALGIHSIADLAALSGTLSIAGDYEFFSRPEWAALQKTYGLNFRRQQQMQPDFMYAAVATGEIDVIAGYTSDGLIAKYDLVVLDDPRHAIPPYDAVMLIAPKRADDDKLKTALTPADRRHRHRDHARGQLARQRQRRHKLAGCGGALAVGPDFQTQIKRTARAALF